MMLLTVLAGVCVVVAFYCAYVIGTRASENGGPGFRVFAGETIPPMRQRTLLMIGLFGGCLLGLAAFVGVILLYRKSRG
jgi:hypothetical protein